MKKPERLVIWLDTITERTEWVDHNGKPLRDVFVKIPTWIVKAYHLDRCKRVKLVVYNHPPCAKMQHKEENFREYFRKNWLSKVVRMRKLNHGYIKIGMVVV